MISLTGSRTPQGFQSVSERFQIQLFLDIGQEGLKDSVDQLPERFRTQFGHCPESFKDDLVRLPIYKNPKAISFHFLGSRMGRFTLINIWRSSGQILNPSEDFILL